MPISVSGTPTANTITVSCSYPTKQSVLVTPADTKPVTASQSCTIFWVWQWQGGSTGSWVATRWYHNAPSTYNYNVNGYVNSALPIVAGSVGPLNRPSAPTGQAVNGAESTKTTSGTASYSGNATKPAVYSTTGATISRTKMYRNGTYVADGSASNSFSYTFSGLSPATTYQLSVQWFESSTDLGTNSTNGTTGVPTPAPLTGLQGSVKSYAPATLVFTWNASANADGYDYSGIGGGTGHANGTSVTWLNMAAGTYTLTVTPKNSVYGTSGASAKTSITVYDPPPPVAPGPLSLHFDPLVGGTSAKASWTVGSNTSYVNIVLNETGETHNLDASFTSQTYTGLTPNKTYTVTATPYNGIPPDPSTAGTPVSASATTYGPPAPVTITALNPRAGKRVGVGWSGGQGASGGFTVYANNRAGSGDVYKGSTDQNGTNLEIQLDQEFYVYTIKVVATNTVGTSFDSGTVQTLDETPPTGLAISATNITDTTADINFGGAVDTMSGVDHYEFYANVGGGLSFSQLQFKASSVQASGVWQYTNMNPNTTYTIGVKVLDVQGNAATSTLTLKTLLLGGGTPDSSPSVSSRIDSGFVLSWSAVPGATQYGLAYKPTVNSVWQGDLISTSTSVTLTTGQYGLQYDFKVRAMLNGVWSQYTAISQATTNPKTPNIVYAYNSSTVTITAQGMLGNPNSFFDAIEIEKFSASSGAVVDMKTTTVNGGSVFFPYSGTDLPLYKYRARSRLLANGTTLYSLSYSNVVSFDRPADFAWDTAKVKGQNIVLTAVEWGNLQKRVNEFLLYKGINQVTWTTVKRGDDITAAAFNEVRNAIALLPNRTVGVGNTVTKGVTDITADALNRLRDSLNSTP